MRNFSYATPKEVHGESLAQIPPGRKRVNHAMAIGAESNEIFNRGLHLARVAKRVDMAHIEGNRGVDVGSVRRRETVVLAREPIMTQAALSEVVVSMVSSPDFPR